jgi:hypothetical protein
MPTEFVQLDAYVSPVTVEQFQGFLRDESTDPDLLDYLETILLAATQRVSEYCNRNFTRSTAGTNRLVTATVFGDDSTMIYWPLFPIRTLGSNAGPVDIIKQSLADWSVADEIDPSNFKILDSAGDGHRILAINGYRFESGYMYQIVLEYGLDETHPVPEAIREAIMLIARRSFDMSNFGSGIFGQEQVQTYHPGTNNVPLYDFDQQWQKIVEPFRMMAI